MNNKLLRRVSSKVLPPFRPKGLSLEFLKSTKWIAVKFTGYYYIITKHVLVKFDSYPLYRLRDIERER